MTIKSLRILILLFFSQKYLSCTDSYALVPHWEPLLALLSLQGKAGTTRQPVIPSALGNSLGNLLYQAYNGTGFNVGAAIQGYYGVVGSGLAAPSVTMPGNVGFSTVPTSSAVSNLTARLLVAAAGNVGIGNFVPGTGSNNGLPNSILNIEGDNTASANSAVHLGLRTTAINALVSGTAYSAQYDGNLYDAGYAQFATNLNVTSTFNTVQATFITQANIPFTISTPGYYCLAANITQNAAAAAITITAAGSGSILDLNDFTITGGVSSTTAISVANNTTDLTIKNGTITTFTQTGITMGTGIARCSLNNINCISCANQGISIGGGDTLFLFNCGVYNSATNASFATPAGIVISNAVNAQLVDCVVDSCGSANTNTFSAINVTGTTAYLTNCIATNNTNSATLVGILAQVTNGAIIQWCDGSGSTSASLMQGINVANNSPLINCSAINNISSAAVDTASFFVGSNVIIQSCITAGSSIQNTMEAIACSSSCLLVDNIIYNLKSTGAGALAVARGLTLPDVSNCVLLRNYCFGLSGAFASRGLRC